MELRFWIEFLILLSILSLLFGVSLVAIGHGTITDIPIAVGMVFSSFLSIGGIFAGIMRLFPEQKED